MYLQALARRHIRSRFFLVFFRLQRERNARIYENVHIDCDDNDRIRQKTMHQRKMSEWNVIDWNGNDEEDEKDTCIFLRSYKSSL